MVQLGLAVARELANGARDALRQGAAVLTGNQGEYIKSGMPESLYGKIQQATARQACRRYADNPSGYNGRFTTGIENACRPYLDSIGYGTGPTLKKPFDGGQCGIRYRVEATYFRYDNACNLVGPIALAGTFDGPIGAPFPVSAPSSPDVTCPGAVGNRWDFTSAGVVRPFSPTVGRGVGALTFNSVVPSTAGTPDTCGNPPPELVDPQPPPVPGPRREPFSPSPDINIDIDLEINPDGTIDIDFGVGPVTIDPFPEGGEDGGGGGGQQPDPGLPGSPEATGPGGEAEGEAPPNSVLVGLRVEILEFPAEPREYAAGVYRGVCYVYMGTEGLLDHDPAGAMLRADQFVYAERENLTHWRVSANTGYSLRVTPYYRELEAETV